MATRKELQATVSGMGHTLRFTVEQLRRLIQKLEQPDREWLVNWRSTLLLVNRQVKALEDIDRKAQSMREMMPEIELHNRDHLQAESFRQYRAVSTAAEMLSCITEEMHRELSEIWDDEQPWTDEDRQSSVTDTQQLLSEVPSAWLDSLIMRAESEMLRYDPWIGWHPTSWYAKHTGRNPSGIRGMMRKLEAAGMARRGDSERAPINMRESIFVSLKVD